MQIQNAMYMEQMQPALRAYLTKLREDAYIDIAQGFVDSGASSKQTKPVVHGLLRACFEEKEGPAEAALRPWRTLLYG